MRRTRRCRAAATTTTPSTKSVVDNSVGTIAARGHALRGVGRFRGRWHENVSVHHHDGRRGHWLPSCQEGREGVQNLGVFQHGFVLLNGFFDVRAVRVVEHDAHHAGDAVDALFVLHYRPEHLAMRMLEETEGIEEREQPRNGEKS